MGLCRGLWAQCQIKMKIYTLLSVHVAIILACGVLITGCSPKEIALSQTAGCPPGTTPNREVREAFYDVSPGEIESVKIISEEACSYQGQALIVTDTAVLREMTAIFKVAYEDSCTQYGNQAENSVVIVFKPQNGKRREAVSFSMPPYGLNCTFGSNFTNCLPPVAVGQAALARKRVLSLGKAGRIRSIRLTTGNEEAALRVTGTRRIRELRAALLKLDEHAFVYNAEDAHPYHVEIRCVGRPNTRLVLFIRTADLNDGGASRIPVPLREYISELERR
jgi:hypothetical protein